MSAKVVTIRNKADFEKLNLPSETLAKGGLVAFPTETVYGLGANALSDDAVKKIFAAKGRPSDNPLIVHVAKKEDVYRLVETVTPEAEKIISHLCPGPITFILNKSELVPDVVTAGGKTVAIRIPENEIARALIEKSGVPVAAPSANVSGRPSPTTAEHVIEDLKDRVDFIIDGGPCKVGLESTVIDLTVKPPNILRPGGVSQEMLSNLLGEVSGYEPDGNDANAPKSPGMKYKHYAPKAKMTVFMGKNCRATIRAYIENLPKENLFVLTAGETEYKGATAVSLGETAEEYAKNLFFALRQADNDGAKVILAELPFSGGGIVTALKNRIFKSCGGNVILCE